MSNSLPLESATTAEMQLSMTTTPEKYQIFFKRHGCTSFQPRYKISSNVVCAYAQTDQSLVDA